MRVLRSFQAFSFAPRGGGDLRRILAALAVLALALPAFAAPRKARMKTLDFDRDVRKERAPDMESARTTPTPAELRFTLDGAPRIEGNAVILRGILENPTARDIPAIVFPVVNWASPFYLAAKMDEHLSWRQPGPGEPPLPPPAPPPPMRFVVPAHTRIAFETQADLARLSWTGSPEVTFEWTFHFWNPPMPSGSFRLRLPER